MSFYYCFLEHFAVPFHFAIFFRSSSHSSWFRILRILQELVTLSFKILLPSVDMLSSSVRHIFEFQWSLWNACTGSVLTMYNRCVYTQNTTVTAWVEKWPVCQVSGVCIALEWQRTEMDVVGYYEDEEYKPWWRELILFQDASTILNTSLLFLAVELASNYICFVELFHYWHKECYAKHCMGMHNWW